MTDYPETNGGRLLRRGDTFDVEDSRQTNRLRTAREILRTLGAEPTVEHSDYTAVEYGRERHFCTDGCKTIWPEWITGPIFDAAYRLADAAITEQGANARRRRSIERSR